MGRYREGVQALEALASFNGCECPRLHGSRAHDRSLHALLLGQTLPQEMSKDVAPFPREYVLESLLLLDRSLSASEYCTMAVLLLLSPGLFISLNATL